MVAGGLMALACGTLFFPVFLLPLWFLFYDRRGAARFGAGLAAVGVVLAGSLILTSIDDVALILKNQMIGAAIDWPALSFRDNLSGGFWQPEIAAYRIPVFVAFCAAGAVVISIWPRQKTLEHLIANSAAIIIGTQFWYPQQGGVYSLWYVPLLLVVIFRPTLSQLEPPRFSRRDAVDQPANVPSAPELVASGTPAAGNGARLRLRATVLHGRPRARSPSVSRRLPRISRRFLARDRPPGCSALSAFSRLETRPG